MQGCMLNDMYFHQLGILVTTIINLLKFKFIFIITIVVISIISVIITLWNYGKHAISEDFIVRQ